MQGLKDSVNSCKLCVLGETCIKKVFGNGNEKANLMFIGEAPQESEQKTGLLFQGDCGNLLTKYIQAMGLNRDNVYITNILKCRPPKNRSPEPLEVDTCSSYLYKQISFINPKIIVALGVCAAHALIDTDQAISKIRGQEFKCKIFSNIIVIPTFHPSFCLRQHSAKIVVWNDLKKVIEILGLR